MLATFVVGSVLLYGGLFAVEARDDAAFVSSWFTLFNDCRLSVEERQPLSVYGLLPTVVAADPSKVSTASRSRNWGPLGGGRFAVLERETDTATGTLRACEVILSDWRKPLSRFETERLTYTFLEERTELILKGGYVAKDPEALPGTTSLGFGPVAPNAVACPVISAIFASADTGAFETITGEQGTHCDGGPSFIKGTAI